MVARGPRYITRKPRCDQMAAMVSAGATLGEVAERFGVSVVAVYRACALRGVHSSHTKHTARMAREGKGNDSRNY